jgi:hypothetical protein
MLYPKTMNICHNLMTLFWQKKEKGIVNRKSKKVQALGRERRDREEITGSDRKKLSDVNWERKSRTEHVFNGGMNILKTS